MGINVNVLKQYGSICFAEFVISGHCHKLIGQKNLDKYLALVKVWMKNIICLKKDKIMIVLLCLSQPNKKYLKKNLYYMFDFKYLVPLFKDFVLTRWF